MTFSKKLLEASRTLHVPLEQLTALAVTYEEAKTQGTPEDRAQEAHHILWALGDSRGLEPGYFTQKLLLAWGSADGANRARLCIGFPLMATAYDVLWNEGKDGLAAWAGLTSREPKA